MTEKKYIHCGQLGVPEGFSMLIGILAPLRGFIFPTDYL
jgi:hypothetical protein